MFIPNFINMKKLSLSKLASTEIEVLTRKELKKVLGGLSSGDGSSPYGQIWNCMCTSGGTEQCEVYGTSDFDFQFENCCGYTCPVDAPNGEIAFCQAAGNNY